MANSKFPNVAKVRHIRRQTDTPNLANPNNHVVKQNDRGSAIFFCCVFRSMMQSTNFRNSISLMRSFSFNINAIVFLSLQFL